MLKRAITIVACFAAMQSTYADAYPGTYHQQRQQSHYQQQSHHHTPKYDFYGGIKGGWGSTRNFKVTKSSAPDEYNNLVLNDSGVYGAMIGYNVADYFRADLEMYRRHPYDLQFFNTNKTATTGTHPTSITSINVMLNGYLLLPLKGGIVPFISGGVGPSWNKINDTISTTNIPTVFGGKTTVAFAYQVGAGVSFAYDRFNVDGEIKYANKGKVKTKLGMQSGFSSTFGLYEAKIHEIMFLASARYNF